MARRVHVASHNIMHAVTIDVLIQRYKTMAAKGLLDILCIQENTMLEDGRTSAQRIAEEMGNSYKVFQGRDRGLSPALVYDAAKLKMVSAFYATFLPVKRSFIAERLLNSKVKLFMYYGVAGCTFTLGDSKPFTVASFHISAFDNRESKFNQIREVARIIRNNCLNRKRVIVCGDTNLFAARKNTQLKLFRKALEVLGINDGGNKRATYHFSRMGENLNFIKYIPRYLEKIGIRFSLRYDVAAGDLPRTSYDHIVTPESDHDMMWAQFEV